MRHLLAILFLCASAFGQGLTLTDFVFIAGTNNVAGGGGGGATAPTEYWSLDEAIAGNRIGSVLSTVMTGDDVTVATGLYGNAAKWASGNGNNLDGLILDTTYTDESISINYWFKMDANTDTSYRVPTMYFSGDGDDVLDAEWATASFFWDVVSGAGSDFISTAPTANTSWHMVTIVFDKDTDFMTGYFDSVLIATTDTPTPMDGGDFVELRMLGNASGDDTRIDEIYLKVGHALDQTEIDWLYNSGAGRTYSDFP